MGIELGKIMGIMGSGAVGGIVALVSLGVMKPAITINARPPKSVSAAIVHPKPIERVDGVIRTLRVARSSDLSFHLIARINDKPLQMLVDTGANITVLTRRDADRLGLPTGDSGDRIDVTGINKMVSSYRKIGKWPIGLGPIALAGVPIAIDDSNELRSSILGQDAFCNIERITIQRDAIEFRHDAPTADGCSVT